MSDSESERSSRRKDRLIQTRVPSVLESTLKEEARKQRLSVSHLIRNILEDTFHLVDNVVVEVDNIVNDSVGLANQLRRDAQKLAANARNLRGAAEVNHGESKDAHGSGSVDGASEAPAAPARDPLAHIFAWNPVVLNRAEHCSKCAVAVAKGHEAFVGMSDDPSQPRAWLCADCADQL